MSWTNNFVTLYRATGEFFAVVGADIFDRKEPAVDVDNGDREIIRFDDFEFARRNTVCRADVQPLFSLQSSVLSLQATVQRAVRAALMLLILCVLRVLRGR